MIFGAWLLLHIFASTVIGLLAPLPAYNPRKLDREARAMILLWYSVPFSWLLDQRDSSAAQFTAGFVMYVLGVSLLTWAKRSNPHFQPQIVMPPEVIRTGAYRWMNHPGYAAMTMMGAASCLMLGHVIGWFLLGAYAFLLMLRAQEEDRLLRAKTRPSSQATLLALGHSVEDE